MQNARDSFLTLDDCALETINGGRIAVEPGSSSDFGWGEGSGSSDGWNQPANESFQESPQADDGPFSESEYSSGEDWGQSFGPTGSTYESDRLDPSFYSGESW